MAADIHGAKSMMCSHFRTLAEPARAEVFRRIGLSLDCADQIGLALIRPHGEYFEFDDQGAVAGVVIPVTDDGNIVDLVAFDANDPTKIWSLTGETELLGEDSLTSLFGCMLRIHRTALEWLLADHDGTVIVRWTPSVLSTLHAAPIGVVLHKRHKEYAEKIERRIAAHTRPAEVFLDNGF